MEQKTLPQVLFIFDEKATRERKSMLTQLVYGLRGLVKVTLLSGTSTEQAVLKKLESESFDLILLPLRNYFEWNKLEAAFGMSRTSGPTIAAYFIEKTTLQDLPHQVPFIRAIVLDFHRMIPAEAGTIVRALASDKTRSGLAPLLQKDTPIYYDIWTQTREMGIHFDALLGTKEWQETEWREATHTLRVALCHAWSFLFDARAAKSELVGAQGGKIARAYFQAAFQSNLLAIRIIAQVPSLTAKSVIDQFWPTFAHASSPVRGMLEQADVVRVHAIQETQDLELTLLWLPTRPSRDYPHELRTLWIEPLSQSCFVEPPFLTSADDPKLKPLTARDRGKEQRAPGNEGDVLARPSDRALLELQYKMQTLRNQVADQEELIRELRAGGIGQSFRLEMPDAPALIDALEERFSQAHSHLNTMCERARALQNQNNQSPQESEALRLKITEMSDRLADSAGRLALLLKEYKRLRDERPALLAPIKKKAS